MSNEKKLNATERIGNLETALMGLYQTCDNMARDLMTIKEAIKLLGNKTEAIAKAANVTDEQISLRMIENNVSELKEKTDALITKGVLLEADEITATSFVVGRESDDDGKVVNPRIQFSVSALPVEIKEKMLRAMVGDVLTLQEGKLKFEVSEIYAIQQAPQEVPEVQESEVQEEAAQA